MGVGEHLLPVPPNGELTPCEHPHQPQRQKPSHAGAVPLGKSVLAPRTALSTYFQGTKLAGKR